ECQPHKKEYTISIVYIQLIDKRIMKANELINEKMQPEVTPFNEEELDQVTGGAGVASEEEEDTNQNGLA
ncbi:hypothetical protein LJC35_06595, partial [Parabacteroides sp. OttesenSCG-928-N08]|nr:hypothetical protein [Parabacteroides sp. OttesenSCG-928-N08]